MPLYIKDDQVAELARELAKRKHTTVTDVVRQALEREAQALEEKREAIWRDIKEMQAVIRAEAKEPFTSNHDFLYDEKGDPVL